MPRLRMRCLHKCWLRNPLFSMMLGGVWWRQCVLMTDICTK